MTSHHQRLHAAAGSRRRFLAGLTTAALAGAVLTLSPAGAGRALAQAAPIPFLTAGQGSAFLPYGQGLAGWLASSDTPIEVRETAGSNENLRAVDADPALTGMAFLGSAAAAVGGSGPFAGAPTANLRALFPTYNTSFQIAALRSSGLTSLAALDGKRVGVGPAGGPAENFFRAAQDVAGVEAVIVNGTPAELGDKLVSGEIDALWQGAIAPIPALVAVQERADAVVFGLSAAETDGMLAALPYLARYAAPPQTYAGQTEEILSVAGWNVVVAHKDMPEETAYALTRNVLASNDPAAEIHPFAASTKAEFAPLNTVVPYHPGALRALREAGAGL